MENRSRLEKYSSKEEKKESCLDREEGRMEFTIGIRAGSLELRNRTGRIIQESVQRVRLKMSNIWCLTYRVERGRMLAKVRKIWQEGRGAGGLDEKRGKVAAQGTSRFG